jgi:CRISPR-associated protein Cas8a1/Csx13
MQSKNIATNISYEKKGLNIMIQETQWNQNADKLLVEAVHKALRNRYGKIAAQAKKLGEPARFDREFERVRTSLMRAKNRQTMRAELADLFARGGINGVLQENWKLLLPLFTGPDWQRAKDLALLALASYQGKGLSEIEETELENNEADTEEVI